MHENRETSELPARGSGAGRPEKAEGRTTGMNWAEESDCAIVPMNQPNKGEPSRGGLSAEVGEGEARTEENISQAYTNPTQGGKKVVSQGLAGVRQRNWTPTKVLRNVGVQVCPGLPGLLLGTPKVKYGLQNGLVSRIFALRR